MARKCSNRDPVGEFKTAQRLTLHISHVVGNTARFDPRKWIRQQLQRLSEALLREAWTESDLTLRLRNEAVLVLLVYSGLRVQEACDVQLRDLDLAGGAVTLRHGKTGKCNGFRCILKC